MKFDQLYAIKKDNEYAIIGVDQRTKEIERGTADGPFVEIVATAPSAEKLGTYAGFNYFSIIGAGTKRFRTAPDDALPRGESTYQPLSPSEYSAFTREMQKPHQDR